MAFFSSLFGGGGGGGRRGREAPVGGNQMTQQQPGQYMNQIPGMAQGQLNPYAERGDAAYHSQSPENYFRNALQVSSQYVNPYAGMQNLYENAPNPYGQRENLYQNNAPRQFGEMANDPSGYLDQIMRRYTPSEGYRFKQDRMGAAARNTAAHGGFAGTQYDQERQADLVRDLLGQDQQQYLKNAMGAQQYGLGGLERMLAGREREGEEYRRGSMAHQLAMLGGAERNQEKQYQGAENQQNRILGTHTDLFSKLAELAANRNAQREGRGFSASTDLANMLGTNLSQLEGLSSGERRQLMENLNSQNQQRYNNKRSRSNMIGQLGGGALGALLGGPAGAQVGSGLGGLIGGIF